MFILAPNAFLEKEMVTHCSVLAWRIPWTEEPGCCSPWGLEESDTTEQLTQPREASLAIIATRHKNSQNRKTASKRLNCCSNRRCSVWRKRLTEANRANVKWRTPSGRLEISTSPPVFRRDWWLWVGP